MYHCCLWSTFMALFSIDYFQDFITTTKRSWLISCMDCASNIMAKCYIKYIQHYLPVYVTAINEKCALWAVNHSLTGREWWNAIVIPYNYEMFGFHLTLPLTSLNAFCVKAIKSDPLFSPHWLLLCWLWSFGKVMSILRNAWPIVKKTVMSEGSWWLHHHYFYYFSE